MQVSPIEFGVIGLVLTFAWKVMDAWKNVFLHKRNIVNGDGPCMECRLKINEIHEQSEVMKQNFDKGAFSCSWRGRDEVRDLLESIRGLTFAVKDLNRTMNGGRK